MEKVRSPLASAVLSFVAVGLGQIYIGKPKKGLVFLAVFAVAYVLMTFLGLFGPVFLFAGLCGAYLFKVIVAVDAWKGAKQNHGFCAMTKYNKWWVYVAYAVICLFVLPAMLKLVSPLKAYKIPSSAMMPTLQVGDHIMASKLYGDTENLKRGDIVTFIFPGMDNPDHPPYYPPPGIVDRMKGQTFIKRIVGLPRETLEVLSDALYINGEEVEDIWGHYLDNRGKPVELDSRPKWRQKLSNYGPVKIPQDMYFVMGDNRYHTNDSRVWGFVRKERLKAKATYLYWAWPQHDRIGTIIE